MRTDAVTQLPANLPPPQDDGTCKHLPHTPLPNMALPSTQGGEVSLSTLRAKWVVVFVYPRTGSPTNPPPPRWNEIAGARGCTPQNVNIGALWHQFSALDAAVFALSEQSTAYQQEMVTRLDVLHPVLSDAGLRWSKALNLPTFSVEGVELNRRLTLVCQQGVIERVFYPVFPPDTHPKQVLDSLSSAVNFLHIAGEKA